MIGSSILPHFHTSILGSPVLPTNQRLRKTSDFKAVYSRGRSYVHPALVVYVLKQPGETARIGFSVSKKLGGAVVRNRIRRRLRDASRSIISRLSPGTDAVVVARSAIADSTVADMESILEAQFQKAGAFAETREGLSSNPVIE